MFAIWPDGSSESQLGEQPLLILLHGYGSNEEDLAGLVSYLPTGINVVSLRAPLAIGPGSYTWYPYDTPGNPDPTLAEKPVEEVLAWLDNTIVPKQTGKIALLGFSMGAAMTVQLMRSRPGQFVAGVNLAGFSINGSLPTDGELEANKPPLFWGRDPHDPVITVEAIMRSKILLPNLFDLTIKTYNGIGHSVSREELEDVSEFLNKHLN